MKNFRKKIFFSIITVIFILSVILSTFVFKKEKKTNTIYNISAQIHENFLSGELLLEYINTSKTNVDDLYFCLYPNAFKSEDNILNTTVKDKLNDAYPNGFDNGYINITDVYVDNEKATYELEEKEQILRVKTEQIKPDDHCDIKISFDVKIPDSPMRFGYGKNTYNFGNWYPVLCPFENGVPIKSLYTANGDPFYSECADYFVDITVSPEFRLATSGKILKKEIKDPLNTKWFVEGKNIRDFAFIISTDYKLKSQQVGDTIVYSYYLNDDKLGQKALDYAVNSLEIFSSMFGEYPYETLTVAESDFYIGGMEYPNLVYINTELYSDSSIEALEEVVVHEVAHQWWYGVVGNNEIDDPWLDEGLTQYSVALYYEQKYGIERYKSFLRENETYCKFVFEILRNAYGDVNKQIARKSSEFEHWLLYDAITYDVASLMFDEIRISLGDDMFFSGLQRYYAENSYKIATKENFINSMYNATNKNIAGIMDPWLNGKIYWG